MSDCQSAVGLSKYLALAAQVTEAAVRGVVGELAAELVAGYLDFSVPLSLNTFAVAANESGGNVRLLLAFRILYHCPFERHCNVV
ncbi:MAG: hypothetical protein ACN6Q5_06655 [Pseudomonas sp.]|uniref:hypothetical protein n=1 Tax=Pseudomonas sp. TaxID=306 RepID=UPI003D0B1C98